MVSVIVLLVVFILIAVRRIGRYRFQIWQVMLAGAIAVLASLQITPLDALKAINLDVILFLFGVFVIGEALEASGYLSYLAYRLFGRARSLEMLVLFVLLGAGTISAFLMNDTLAIIGTPVMLLIARNNNGSAKPKMLLLALAFAVTIGSVMSPIGNPQNLLVAINGEIRNPFLTFFKFLLVPTVINLFVAYLVLRLFFRKDFHHQPVSFTPEPLKDAGLARLTQISLGLLIALVVTKIILVFASPNTEFRLTYIALAAAAPIILFSRKRVTIIRKIDWSTLVFFAAMFILMQSVWDSGFFQSIINGSGQNLASTGIIMGVSVVLSQFISNVPLVALYLPMLSHAGATTTGMMALAAGSTIAGNLTILGAASNVIIIQNAEKKGNQTLTFWEFFKVGVPLTVLNCGIYWLFFLLVH
jgi:Na+/H+ antiporter NhaD/arsenite permease-like protein